MAMRISDLQTAMRFAGAERSLTITEGAGLAELERIYRYYAAALPWPELTRENTSITTEAKVARYAWITSPVFLDVRAVEIQDADDALDYKQVYPAPDMDFLNQARRKKAKAVPDYYFRMHDGTQHIIEFAPAPEFAVAVRVTGIIEPDDLIDANDKTVFLQKAADDALAFLLAAHYQSRDGFFDRAQDNAGKAERILQRLFGKELVPAELLRQIVNN